MSKPVATAPNDLLVGYARPGKDRQPNADLRSGEANARRVHHRVGEVLDQLAQLGVERRHRICGRPQHRITEQADRPDTHCIPPGMALVSAGRRERPQPTQVYEARGPAPASGDLALKAALRAARATPGSG